MNLMGHLNHHPSENELKQSHDVTKFILLPILKEKNCFTILVMIVLTQEWAEISQQKTKSDSEFWLGTKWGNDLYLILL